jgi:hypothetical protein
MISILPLDITRQLVLISNHVVQGVALSVVDIKSKNRNLKK